MNHTDPIADMLTRIRNSIMAEKREVTIPQSKIKYEIAKILKKEGYISSVKKSKSGSHPQITLELKYKENKKNVIEALKRISKPGRRVYSDVNSIPKVLGGLGIAILSTSSGIMTGKDCEKNNIGGEVLLYVW